MRVPHLDPGRHVRDAHGLPRAAVQRDGLLPRRRAAARHRGPDPRAGQRHPRDDDGAQPDLLAPRRARHRRHGARRAHRDDLRLPRARADPRHLRDDHRPADEPRLHPPGGVAQDLPPGAVDKIRDAASRCCATTARRTTQTLLDRQRDLDGAHRRTSATSTSTGCMALGITGPICARPACRTTCASRSRTAATRPTSSTSSPRPPATPTAASSSGIDEMRRVAARSSSSASTGCGPARSWSRTRRSPGRRSSRSAATAWATPSTTSATSWASRWRR